MVNYRVRPEGHAKDHPHGRPLNVDGGPIITAKFIVFLAFWIPFAVEAVVLAPGDILVASSDSGGRIIHIDRDTGDISVVSSEGFLREPTDLFLESTGDLLVADFYSGAVIRIDPETGDQNIVSSGGRARGFMHGDLDSNGNLVIADFLEDVIFQIDVTTGEQVVIAEGGLLSVPLAVLVDDSNTLVVLDEESGVIKIDRVNGEQSVISPAPDPIAIARSILGSLEDGLYVTDCRMDHVIKIDASTGGQETIVGDGFVNCPYDIEFDVNGDLLVVDKYDEGVVRVNPVTGTYSTVARLPRGSHGLLVIPLEEYVDSDGDSVPDEVDNCELNHNPNQEDTDRDGVGDACNDHIDIDGDDWADHTDNCVETFNSTQNDSDGDGTGDGCDPYPFDPENDLALCFDSLNFCEGALFLEEESLGECLSEAETLSSELQACTQLIGVIPDKDEDGEADSTDSCPETGSGSDVDSDGCSIEQFCEKVEIVTWDDRKLCRRLDWNNDEPVTRPEDCHPTKKGSDQGIVKCIPR